MRGWDRFLTDRDKAHVVRSGNRTPRGFGDNPCVLVIDVYYGSVGTERQPLLESIERWPRSCGLEGWAAIDEMVGVLDAARSSGVPVIYLRQLQEFPSAWGNLAVSGQYKLEMLAPEVRARTNEIVAEVAPREGELVIEKAAASGFQGTPLLFHLNALDVDTVIAMGETTSGCVRATVVDGCTYRFKMAIVEDCTYDRTEASHWMNLFDMDQKYGDVVSAAQVKAYLRSVVPERG